MTTEGEFGVNTLGHWDVVPSADSLELMELVTKGLRGFQRRRAPKIDGWTLIGWEPRWTLRGWRHWLAQFRLWRSGYRLWTFQKDVSRGRERE